MFDFASDGLDADDWFCSGSLIAPTVFLTAAHCLEFLPGNAQIYVTFKPTVADGVATAIPATSFHFDPLYGHDQSNPHDIGVVLLPAKRTRGITPLRLPPAGYLDQLADKNGLKDQKFINVALRGRRPGDRPADRHLRRRPQVVRLHVHGDRGELAVAAHECGDRQRRRLLWRLRRAEAPRQQSEHGARARGHRRRRLPRHYQGLPRRFPTARAFLGAYVSLP